VTRTDQRPVATISVDLDGAATHLRGYGQEHGSTDSLLATAIPRLLQVLDEAGVRATMFVVAGDQPPAALLSTLAQTHEIAAHSVTHPMPFAGLAASELAREVGDAKQILEDRVGMPVVGFRAPNWDTGPAVWQALAEADYQYDASLLPTPWQVAIRTVLALGARSLRPVTAMRPIPSGWQRLPHTLATTAGPIRQFPVPTTPTIRFPVYHTVRYRLSQARFEGIVAELSRRGEPFGYALHAIDLVSIADRGIPSSLRRHPGMDLELGAKLALLRSSIGTVVEQFRTVAYADRLPESMEAAGNE
jgi:peptidoglycan/xylan/chitin deacetylase (PgdA/CDA1 family)